MKSSERLFLLTKIEVLNAMRNGNPLGIAETAIDDVSNYLAARASEGRDGINYHGYTNAADFLSALKDKGSKNCYFDQPVSGATPSETNRARSNGGGAKPSDGMICGLPTEEFNRLPPDRRLELYAESNRPAGI